LQDSRCISLIKRRKARLFVERLDRTAFVGPERAAALKDESTTPSLHVCDGSQFAERREGISS
jgi:hypothetical protein